MLATALPEATPSVAIAHRSSAGSVLLAEKRSNRLLSDTMGLLVAAAAAEAAHHERFAGVLDVAALASFLLSTSKRMVPVLTESLRKARSQARLVGAARAAAELKAGGGARLLSRLKPIAVTGVDHHADMAAESLIAQWRGKVMHSVRAARKEAVRAESDRQYRAALGARGSTADGIYRTGAEMGRALARTAATETVRAYGEGHVETTEDLLVLDDGGALIVPPGGLPDDVGPTTIYDRWSAILDKRTCPECAAYDDAHTLVGQPFAFGEEPGWVHPFCRCIRVLHFVTLQ